MKKKPISAKKMWYLILNIGLFIVIIRLTLSILDLYKRQDIVKQMQNKYKTLSLENENLKNNLEYVQTPEFIEKESRNKLGLAREGDTVVLIGTGSATPSGTYINLDIQSLPESSKEMPKGPKWKLWWEVFF